MQEFCVSLNFHSRRPCVDGRFASLFSGTEGLLKWNDNWVSFLDTVLQMMVVATPGRDLRLPTRIRSLCIDPVRHEQFVNTLEDGTKGTVATLFVHTE